jgi:hypothetical protein
MFRLSILRRARAAAYAAVLLLAGCAAPPPGLVGADPAHIGQAPEENWQPFVLPGKRATQYLVGQKEGRWAIEARADRSASMLRRKLDMPAEGLDEVSWSWWVDATLPDADLADAERTDAPVRVVLAFDGDRSRLSPRARMMFDLARALTGEEPPYATLVYAWSTKAPVESVVHNPRTDRIRKIVVDSGSAHTRRWREHRRNIVADFKRAYGEPPGRLVGVAIMTDADNTRSKARAWYGRISFHPGGTSPCKASDGKSCSKPKS